MPEYAIKIEGRVIEHYVITAVDEDDAAARWHEGQHTFAETVDVDEETIEVTLCD